MLDLKFIRENKNLIAKGLAAKNVKIDLEELLALDEKVRGEKAKVENLRAEKNKLGKDDIAKAKKVKEELKTKEEHLTKNEKELRGLLYSMPNLPASDVPIAPDERGNKVIRKVGKPPKLDFKPRDHVELGKNLDLIDIERAAKISGSRFYYLKGEAVLLEFALINWAIELVSHYGFTPIIPPILAHEDIFYKMGYLPEAENEMYKTTQDNLRLGATSEQTIGPYFQNEILKAEELPKRFLGFSSCFRREAGSYGKDVKGIFRAHQFDKLEMFSFTRPIDSPKEHELLLQIEEKIVSGLGLPYQVVLIASGDLGFPAAKKYDIETWIPSQERYRETHSTSNCTDFQARRLNIRCKDKKGIVYTHTLNGTGIAIGRILIAILENYQQADGSIKIPEVLHPYIRFTEIKR